MITRRVLFRLEKPSEEHFVTEVVAFKCTCGLGMCVRVSERENKNKHSQQVSHATYNSSVPLFQTLVSHFVRACACRGGGTKTKELGVMKRLEVCARARVCHQ